MLLTTIYSYLFVIASAVVPISALSVLVQRQAIDNPTCAANCTTILTTLESCATASCLCSNATAVQILDCVNCNVQKVATPQDIEDNRAALNAYGTRCAAAGLPLIPLEIDAGASQSSGLGTPPATSPLTRTESSTTSPPAPTSSGAGSPSSGTAPPSSSGSLAASAPSSESTTASPASTSGPSSSQTTSPGTLTSPASTRSTPSTTPSGTNEGRHGVTRASFLAYVGTLMLAGIVTL